jgi:hypothetical protein
MDRFYEPNMHSCLPFQLIRETTIFLYCQFSSKLEVEMETMSSVGMQSKIKKFTIYLALLLVLQDLIIRIRSYSYTSLSL